MGRGPGSTRHGEGQDTWCRLCFGLRTDLQESRVPETQGKFWRKDDLPSGAEDGVGEPLNRLRNTQVHRTGWDVSRSAEGADWCHCKATLDHLWKVMVIRKGSWGLEEGRYHNLSSRRIWGITAWSASLQLLGRWGQKPVPETVSKHSKEKKVMGNSQHQFMKEKLCSFSLIVISL